ncbi:DUF1816 domain-containing protein [Leptolyngbya sp. FACHB-261]|uniref:DUF1816 domain-containing protein n=1 Tax=Leptolyngbya sp. FACHB-261 TaxID=2692806 RepID=UPI00168511F7|nr:DUF1816 domain-containing protein [Leptolyngbya sp. FACHB-261]MBD2102165.1 DUF1816 domain-containing protein [Leptolyngbya sp. FACHB-261]
MTLLDRIKEIFLGPGSEAPGTAWWAEVTTSQPPCTYYFGPFDSSDEARDACPGYVEDLRDEGAQGIEVTVKRCNPEALTVAESEAD